MHDAPDFAHVAALLGDPARARMLTMLMSGTALTATELAQEAGVTASTASAHLAKLTETRILSIERQGRHRYFRLFDADVAALLEQLLGIAGDRPAPRRRPGPSDPALRTARVCYDHLAGERGVWLLETLRERAFLTGNDGCSISPAGASFFAKLDIDVASLSTSRRPLCRPCLDWSERRHHLGGALGAEILTRLFALRWAKRELDSRIVIISSAGDRALRALFAS
jgi:DNA-binding transcriptional ArsR family regulator